MLQKLANECPTPANILCIPTDATKEVDCKNLMARAAEQFGGIDIMIYCVGQAMHALFHQITDLNKVMHHMMDTNFTGCVYCTYHSYNYLKESKGQAVVVSSIAGDISPPYLTFYAAAKHAVQGFYESLQNEENGVHYTIVCPGYVLTEIDDKKVVGDGTVQSVELNVDKSKYMPADKAAKLIIEAQEKRKKKYQLTTSGSMGTTLYALFPDMINSVVRDEIKKITDVDKKKNKKVV